MNHSQKKVLSFKKKSVKDELSRFNIILLKNNFLKIKIILINLTIKGCVMSDELKIPSSQVLVKQKKNLQKPKLFKVILLNDDYTPMEYVVKLLKQYLINQNLMQ